METREKVLEKPGQFFCFDEADIIISHKCLVKAFNILAFTDISRMFTIYTNSLVENFMHKN